jgi:hypothetical protein
MACWWRYRSSRQLRAQVCHVWVRVLCFDVRAIRWQCAGGHDARLAADGSRHSVGAQVLAAVESDSHARAGACMLHVTS